MMGKWRLAEGVLAVAGLFIALPQVTAAGASTFVTSNSDNNLTFSINVPADASKPNDFAFYLSAPHGNSWVGVGFGKGMKDAFMLIAYTSSNGKNLTLSPRLGTGHVEPSYSREASKTMSIEMRDGTGIKDGRYVANGICHNCKTWQSGSIDFDSTAQPMIYAVGPDELHLSTNALGAGLRRHDYYGSFTIDLQAAKGDIAHFPPTDLSIANATLVGHEHNDHEYSSSLHAVAMAGTFVIVFPVGVFYQKVLRTARWHWITQAFGVVVVLAGAGLGLGMSHYYNRSKHFNSAHQLIGIVVVLLVLLQASLGSVHHRIFKTKQQPTIMGVIHRFLGPVLICVGIINGVLGFNLAVASHHNIGYAIIVLIVVIILFGAAFFQTRRRRRQEAFNTPAAQNFSNAYNNPSYTNDIPLQPSSGRPPAYGRPLGA